MKKANPLTVFDLNFFFFLNSSIFSGIDYHDEMAVSLIDSFKIVDLIILPNAVSSLFTILTMIQTFIHSFFNSMKQTIIEFFVFCCSRGKIFYQSPMI